MGFGTMRRVALWAVVFSALGIGVHVLVQGASAPPPLKLGPGVTIQQSAIPTQSRPIEPSVPAGSGTPSSPETTSSNPSSPASSAPASPTPASSKPAPSTAIPSKSAPVKPLPPSRADDDDDDDDGDDDGDDRDD